jgi:hypothetical protein
MLMMLIYREEGCFNIKENAKDFLVSSEEIGLGVNADKTK